MTLRTVHRPALRIAAPPKSWLRVAVLAGILLGLTTAACQREVPPPQRRPDTPPAVAVDLDRVTNAVRERFDVPWQIDPIRVGDQVIHAPSELTAFYVRRNHRPAWFDAAMGLPRADSLLQALSQADREGLAPEDYHLVAIGGLIQTLRSGALAGRASDPNAFADLDLLLSDAFVTYASHLREGRVDPLTFKPRWVANERKADLPRLLEEVVASGGVAGALRNLAPSHPGYARLRQALSVYRSLSARGSWRAVASDSTLRKGDTGSAVAAAHARLIEIEELSDSAHTGATFDEQLENEVRDFQRHHGLEPDGAIGAATLRELNVPPAHRIRQMEANMERWRWLPADLGRRHILVNIAGFTVELFDDSRLVLSTRAVVGRSARRTPVFSDTMRYLVLSPYWHVPSGIAINDIVPAVRRDAAYLTRMRITVFTGSGADTRQVNPKGVDWAAVSRRNFPYRFRQEPGPDNALGGVKFMFPNRFNVYIHDTPARALFERAARDFSSGCIRIEKVVELAQYLLRDQGWTRERIEAAMAGPSEPARSWPPA